MDEKKRKALSKLPQFRGEVTSKNTIRSLPDVKVGEIFWVELDEKPFIVTSKTNKRIGLSPLDEQTSVSTGITVYDFNHDIVAKEPLFNWEDSAAVNKLKNDLLMWFNCNTNSEFYLLYGRDIHYLSLLRRKNPNTTYLTTLKELIEAFSELISMDFSREEDAEQKVEIWVRTSTNKAELLYLFPFDNGIVNI